MKFFYLDSTTNKVHVFHPSTLTAVTKLSEMNAKYVEGSIKRITKVEARKLAIEGGAKITLMAMEELNIPTHAIKLTLGHVNTLKPPCALPM